MNKTLKIVNIGISVLSIRLLSQNASVNTTGSSGSRYIRSSFGSESRKIDRSHACAERTIKILRAKVGDGCRHTNSYIAVISEGGTFIRTAFRYSIML